MGWWCASRIPYAPNGWNIYRPTFGIQFMVNVGKYSIHGINMGIGISYEHVPWNFMDLILLQWWWYHYINFVANHHDIGNAWDLTNSANFAGSGSFQSCHGPTVDVYEIRLTTWDVWNLVKSRLKLVFFCNVFCTTHRSPWMRRETQMGWTPRRFCPGDVGKPPERPPYYHMKCNMNKTQVV